MELVLQRWSWAAALAAVLAGAWLGARIVNTVVESNLAPKPSLLQAGPGAAPAAPAPAHAELDVERFARVFELPNPRPIAEGAPEPVRAWSGTPVRTSLRGTLVGTAIAEPARYSLCQILNPDLNETQVYAVGDRYQGARIYAIEKTRVLLDHDGVNEYLDDNNGGGAPNLGVQPMPAPGQPPGGAGDVKQLSESQYVVAKSTVNDALTNLSQLATQARIVPSFKNGVANGFKMFSIVPDSLYAKIGIQNGDVIRKINGYEMNSPDKALEIYQKLRDANRIEVELERRGETLRKSYSIE